MAQIARPCSDISEGLWTPTPLYAPLGRMVLDDSQYITSSDDPVLDTFQVKMDRLAWPAAGPVLVQVRLRGLGSVANQQIIIKLMQGSLVIASNVINVPATQFTTYSFQLTPAQLSLITDYGNLSLQVSTSCAPVSDCGCESAISPQLTISFGTDGVGSMACWNGYTAVLNIVSVDSGLDCPFVDPVAWYRPATAVPVCHPAMKSLFFTCSPPGHLFILETCFGANLVSTQSSVNCDSGPFLWQGVYVDYDTGDTVSVTVSE